MSWINVLFHKLKYYFKYLMLAIIAKSNYYNKNSRASMQVRPDQSKKLCITVLQHTNILHKKTKTTQQAINRK